MLFKQFQTRKIGILTLWKQLGFGLLFRMDMQWRTNISLVMWVLLYSFLVPQLIFPQKTFQYLDSIAQTPGGGAGDGERRDSLINYSSKAHRKRKRLSRIAVDGTPVSTGKRRSSVSDAGLLSMSGSFIDCTASPDKHEASKLSGEILNFHCNFRIDLKFKFSIFRNRTCNWNSSQELYYA